MLDFILTLYRINTNDKIKQRGYILFPSKYPGYRGNFSRCMDPWAPGKVALSMADPYFSLHSIKPPLAPAKVLVVVEATKSA